MGNMSYCRFENTANDLKGCLEALQDPKREMTDLSDYEKSAVKELLDLCKEITEMEIDADEITSYKEPEDNPED